MQRIITIKELKETLDYYCWQDGRHNFQVVEDFMDRREFIIENLQVEIEDEYVMFNDGKEVLLNNSSVLSMFLKSNMFNVELNNKNMQIILLFTGGYVQIDIM